ncbi:MAG TPA: TonB-dependent receptor [Vicinamibacterales bacterium]|nr:TonB-dependent receptor [Vicinamibacterales bacterium]
MKKTQHLTLYGVAALVILFLGLSSEAGAQSGLGGLRGAVTDQQGAGLPGVTVTATSPDVLRPQSDVTNERGEYRLNNLPPGTFTLTAELPGFATFKREAILVRVGATFAVDITMQLSTVQETVTVTGDSPMIEVDKPGNVLNIDGDFQRLMPIQARRNYSDFLELTPGVISRGFDDGSGRQVYFGHGTEHFAHVLQLEGTIATNYHDAQLTYVSMGADMVQDIQVKTGGVDASSPMGVGLVMNIVTKSGGNTFRGSAATAYQPFNWNGNNVDNCSTAPGCKPGSGGTPTTAYVRQFDVALGGPIKKDKVWFFGALRRAVSAAGISRTATEVERINAYKPGSILFNNDSESWQPFLKVSGRAGKHDVQGFFQQDRLRLTGDREYNYERIQAQSTGGPLYSGKVTSVWGMRTTTTFTASYNGKGGNDTSTFESLGLTGPQIIIHDSANIQGSTVQGSGRLLEGGNQQSYGFQPASQIVVRGDVTYYRDDWAGNHQFQTGFFAAPRSTYDLQTEYVNNGFVLEEHRLLTPGNIAGGTVPFRRRYFSPVSLNTRAARDRDIGIYVQDTWHPSSRITLNLGVRADFVTRNDDIFNIQRQNSTSIGPRAGFSYLLTKDSRNILRGSYVRVHEQVMGRDAITLFGATEAAAQRNEYDADGDGRFETVVDDAARNASIADFEFAKDLHQPYVDEFILGFRKQFPGQLSLDIAGISRSYQDMWARVDINGIYPSGPNQPFGGFGAIDPTRGIIFQQQNNSWSTLEYRAIEVTMAKNLSNRFQAMVGLNRQWQHFGGTWNPTDPARFIQPDAFKSNALLYMPRGNNEENSLPITTGTTVHTYGPTWQEYSMRFGGSYHAPFGVNLSASYTILAGPWSGPIVDLLPIGDPQLAVFGPGRTANGQTNPLSTRMRFVNANRGEGQEQAPPIKTLGLNFNKSIGLGTGREAVLSVAVFNVLNGGNYSQYNYSGANERFNPNFLQLRNQQPARAAQVTVLVKF